MSQPQKLLDIMEIFSLAQAQVEECSTPKHVLAMGYFAGECALKRDLCSAMLLGMGCEPDTAPPELVSKLFAIAYNMGRGKVNLNVPFWMFKEDA